MACKGSGVQIPSAPPQVRGRIRPRPFLDRPPRQIGSNHRCAGRSVAHRGAIPAALARAVSWSDLPTAITPRSGGIRTPTVTVRAHPAPSRIPQLSRGSSGAGKYFWRGRPAPSGVVREHRVSTGDPKVRSSLPRSSSGKQRAVLPRGVKALVELLPQAATAPSTARTTAPSRRRPTPSPVPSPSYSNAEPRRPVPWGLLVGRWSGTSWRISRMRMIWSDSPIWRHRLGSAVKGPSSRSSLVMRYLSVL
jgi:hypothetical protein